MSTNLISIGLGVGFVWLIVLTVLIYGYLNKIKELTKGVNEGNLLKVLKNISNLEKGNSRKIKKNAEKLKGIDKEILSHVQKMGFVRFNPFNELGGDHSFSLALLNGKNDGVVITGLHTRERTRIYVKEIKGGNCEAELSKEEKKALKKAI